MRRAVSSVESRWPCSDAAAGVDEVIYDAHVLRTRAIPDSAQNELLVDDTVNDLAVRCRWSKNLQTVLVTEASRVELLLHGKPGPQQPHAGMLLSRTNRLARGIGDMQEWDRNRILHVRRHPVHRIGCDQQ